MDQLKGPYLAFPDPNDSSGREGPTSSLEALDRLEMMQSSWRVAEGSQVRQLTVDV